MKTPRYEDYQGMIVKVLGWEAAQDGDGAEAFVHSLSTFDDSKGKFSTWFYHNLKLVRLQKAAEWKINTLPIEEAYGIEGASSPHEIVEFRDSLKTLSLDAQTVVNCVFEYANNCQEKKRKRTVWPDLIKGGSGSSRREIRKQIKTHCKYTLKWSWPRYWSALHEIEALLKEN